ncbi:39S ribosomal protein L38, mitochondrial isoform X1 [Takifugu flavidus]|uniref:39S ribosomal protein L38, mitochondrial isoform X1 n=1 Tax=Takifugu flavidus TaxID=433684 RepID=UPI0025442FBB|nr:39S ribosomal protein L38, mitochondrial isoform X1 [Takifugu flavidus]
MALRMIRSFALRNATDLVVNTARTLVTTAIVCKHTPLGPMPNDEIDVKNLESLEKYRSYTPYLRQAEEAKNKQVWWKTYRGYLEKADPVNDVERVDIGMPFYRPCRTIQVRERQKIIKNNKKNVELERALRRQTFKIPLDRVQETWEQSNGPFQIKRLADHYGVFKDLFSMAYFIPQVPLHICYNQDNTVHVHYGNRLTPTETASLPEVSFDAEEGSLWTLLLTSPDEHLLDNEAEYIHWLVGNIPGKAVQAGQELCHYLPPFPARGTGFHRYIYVLFKQDARIDFKEDIRPLQCHSLKDRTFNTLEFYRKHQDSITPAGLAFFQSQWDESVTKTFHSTLSMKEPVFEFIRPPVYHPPQVKYPHRRPLRYLDRYRDGKEHTYGIY